MAQKDGKDRGPERDTKNRITRVKVRVDFYFNVDLINRLSKIQKHIEEQIGSDVNAYFQNDENIAQMNNMDIYEMVSAK